MNQNGVTYGLIDRLRVRLSGCPDISTHEGMGAPTMSQTNRQTDGSTNRHGDTQSRVRETEIKALLKTEGKAIEASFKPWRKRQEEEDEE